MLYNLNISIRTILCLIVLGISSFTYAGTPCEETSSTPGTIQKSLNLSTKVIEVLENSNSDIALVARVGQDLSKYNLRFSHVGFIVKNHPDGKWSILHDLNLCGTDASALYIQGIGNFFSDDMFAYEAGILLLPKDVQQRLADILISNTKIKQLHEPKYSVVAYPFNTLYQNSNQWVLEILASAMTKDKKIENRIDAQKWLNYYEYKPTLLNIPKMTRLGARMFKANIAFNDHPDEYRYSDKIYAVTVDSVYDFILKLYPQDTQRIIVTLD